MLWVTTINGKEKKKSVAFCKEDLLQFCFSLWQPYSVDPLWGLCKSEHNSKRSGLRCSFHRTGQAITLWHPSCDENFRFINQGHFKGEYGFWKQTCCWRRTVTQVSQRLGDVSVFLVSLKKRACQPKTGRCEWELLQQRHNGRQTQQAGEGTHLSVSPVMHHLSILPRKKNRQGGWWMAPLTGGEQSRLIPKGLKRENDYFLAKWFWLEVQLNLVWDGTLNQYSNTDDILWLNSFKVTDFIQTWISWFGYTESSWPFFLHNGH